MKKKKIISIIFLLMFFIVGVLCTKKNIICIPDNMMDFQLNIVTIATVFAGFSFSVLGLLISLMSSEAMIKIQETNLISNSCETISKSIIAFILSVFVSLSYILGIEKFIKLILLKNHFNIDVYLQIREYIFVYGILFMVAGIILFVKSVHNMVNLMNYIFKQNKKNVSKKIEDFKKAVEKAEHDYKKAVIEDDNCFHDE